MTPAIRRCGLGLLAVMLLATVPSADAGGNRRRRAAPIEAATVTTVNPANANAESPMLGTFYPTPSIRVGGASPTGAGYSPLGQYGLNNLTIYGPTSAFRATSAPIRVYSRGYDGRTVLTEARSVSTPYYPQGSPVVYPTPNSDYYRPRGTSFPPTWPSPINWLDQN